MELQEKEEEKDEKQNKKQRQEKLPAGNETYLVSANCSRCKNYLRDYLISHSSDIDLFFWIL